MDWCKGRHFSPSDQPRRCFYHILLTFIRSAWPMRHHRPTAGQPNPCIEFAKCQNDNPAIMRIAHFRPPAALTANNAVSRVRLLTFDAFRKENTALRHRLQPFARTPPDYVSGNMQHKVTSCFPFLEHYRLSTSIKISSRLYMNSRFTPEYSTTGRHLRPDMRRKKVFSAPSDFFLS